MKKRVKIPVSNPAQLLDLAKKVQSKHTADGDGSLLKILNWTEITPTIEAAVANHEKARQLKREMVEAYQQRNLQLQEIIQAVRDSRDILSGAFKKEMKVLGQWGYEVLDVRSNAAEPKTEKV
ncbi:MAG TPA: hypothetical protein VFW11_24050 [Cyclobacteriaceae bacterium]|nr:hypothetical protein [Cyclobacteriaceae bacterium]